MIGRVLRRAARLFWLLPGFLLWASFPPMGEGTDAVFALVPLIWLTRRSDVRTNVRRWFLNGFLFWFATLAWMPAIVKNGGPWPLVVLGWGALAAYCALFFAAYGGLATAFWRYAKGRGYGWRLFGLLLVEPVLWAGLEIVRSRLFGGFSWNQLGVVSVNSGFGSPAAIGGVYLCSALIVLLNGMLASLVERVWKWNESGGWSAWTRPLETIVPLVLVCAVYGVLPVRTPSAANEPARTLRVAVVQRDFPCVFAVCENDPEGVYAKLLENVIPLKPDLVILPESALCEFGSIGSERAARFARRILDLTGAKGVLTGGGRFADGREYNSAALYTRDRLAVYDKVHLVPFGEYIPGDKLFPALQKLAPVGSCTPGELSVLDFDGVGLGVAICYEDTDSAQIRRLVDQGADLLVFITNDSWFSHSEEAEQHAWQSVARAVETDRAIARAGNSGVSGVVTPDGRAFWIMNGGLPLVDARATLVEDVRVGGGRTLYRTLGDKPIFIAFLLLIGGMILVKYRNHYEKRRYLSLQ